MTNQDIDRISATPLNFVIGKERSGTTLLQVLLNSHPHIAAPPESRFIIMFCLKYGSKTRWTEKDVKKFCNDLYSDVLFRNYWNINEQKFYSSLLEVKEKLNYQLLCKLVFHHFAPPSKECKMFIDKNPLYYCFLNELEELFPDAKYIYIVRDYRDNILSHKKVATIRLNAADIAYKWLRINKIVDVFKTKFPERWLTVKYEELVTDPENTMKRICVFLSIPFSASMIENHNSKLFQSFYENNSKNEFKKYHTKIFEPISTSFIDDWKNKMSKEDQAIAESIAGQYAEKAFGYKTYSERNQFKMNVVRMLYVKAKYIAIIGYFRLVLKHRWAFFLHRNIVKNSLKFVR